MVRPIVVLAGLAVLGGCASSRVTLLNGEPGRPVGAVAVQKGDTETLVDQAGSSAALGSGATRVRAGDPAALEARNQALLGYLPRQAKAFNLNFQFNSTKLTPESLANLDAVKAELRARRDEAPEVQIVGHTDCVDDDARNDPLSLARAQATFDELRTELGLSETTTSVAGRGRRAEYQGKRCPANPAEAQPDEGRRRVEIIIR